MHNSNAPCKKPNERSQLEADIDKQLLQFGGAAFVKLNTRRWELQRVIIKIIAFKIIALTYTSPKDVVFESKNEKVEELLQLEINKLRATSPGQEITSNDEMIAFITAGTHAMKYTSGREVIQVREPIEVRRMTRTTDADKQLACLSRFERRAVQGQDRWHAHVRRHSPVDWFSPQCRYVTRN